MSVDAPERLCSAIQDAPPTPTETARRACYRQYRWYFLCVECDLWVDESHSACCSKDTSVEPLRHVCLTCAEKWRREVHNYPRESLADLMHRVLPNRAENGVDAAHAVGVLKAHGRSVTVAEVGLALAQDAAGKGHRFGKAGKIYWSTRA